MKKKTIILLVVLLALSPGLASTASADEISATGAIWAKGAGLAILRGDGEIHMQGHGVGIVWIKNAETLEVTGHGHRWEAPGGATVFWGWWGKIQASGDNVTVWMIGGVIELIATGTGRVYLRGHGRYEINGHEGVWSPTGEILSMETVAQA